MREFKKQELFELPQTWKSNAAEAILTDNMSEQRQIMLLKDKGALYRLYEHSVQLPKVGKSVFRADYVLPEAEKPEEKELRLHYDPEGPGIQKPHAEMNLRFEPGNKFNLNHRFVRHDLRRNDIGSTLLSEAEALVQELANKSGKTFTVYMDLRRKPMMQWALENNFVAGPGDQTLLTNIFEKPEDYQIVDLLDESGTLREGYVFFKNVRELDRKKAIPVRLQKAIAPVGGLQN